MVALAIDVGVREFPKLGPSLVGVTSDEVPTSRLTELSPGQGSSG